MLGKLHLAEALPPNHRDGRLTLHNGQYRLAVTFRAHRRTSETQARAVALDPGVRTFLTWFSETDAGQIGKHDFGRIQRLCQHLDQPHQQDGQDRIPPKAQPAEGRGPDESPHNQPHK